MLQNFCRRVGAAVLCLSMLVLPGCTLVRDKPEDAEGAVDAFNEDADIEVTSSSDGLFGISYVSDETLNPYTVSGSANLSVTGLIYNSLFTLDESFAAIPDLCEVYNPNEDFTEYTFKIKSGINFSDGTELTAEDTIYSLSCARDSKLYGDRLSIISDVSVAVDEEGEEIADTIVVTLERAHGDLPLLLDIPIIKSGSLNDKNPPGTGPYKYAESDANPRLVVNTSYWGGAVPIDEIYLIEKEDTASAFDSAALDVINLDPTNNSLSLAGTQDIRVYNTTVMEYIGFNMSRIPNADVRKAISSAINREEIIKTCLRSSCSPTPLPIHPNSNYYSGDLAAAYEYNMDIAERLIDRVGPYTSEEPSPSGVMGLENTEAEGEETTETEEAIASEAETTASDTATGAEEEAETSTEAEAWLSLKLLVCSDSTARFESAKIIADSLKKLGIEVTVVGKNYNEYIAALEDGSFDLYYGQVKLKADFDLSSILASSGSINYGHVSGGEYSELIRAFLSANEETKATAAEGMCEYIMENAPISVIGFKKMEVITKQGVVVDMEPHQDNIFADVTAWKITV